MTLHSNEKAAGKLEKINMKGMQMSCIRVDSSPDSTSTGDGCAEPINRPLKPGSKSSSAVGLFPHTEKYLCKV